MPVDGATDRVPVRARRASKREQVVARRQRAHMRQHVLGHADDRPGGERRRRRRRHGRLWAERRAARARTLRDAVDLGAAETWRQTGASGVRVNIALNMVAEQFLSADIESRNAATDDGGHWNAKAGGRAPPARHFRRGRAGRLELRRLHERLLRRVRRVGDLRAVAAGRVARREGCPTSCFLEGVTPPRGSIGSLTIAFQPGDNPGQILRQQTRGQQNSLRAATASSSLVRRPRQPPPPCRAAS